MRYRTMREQRKDAGSSAVMTAVAERVTGRMHVLEASLLAGGPFLTRAAYKKAIHDSSVQYSRVGFFTEASLKDRCLRRSVMSG